MSDIYTFHPPRRAGVIFHLVVITALTVSGGWGLYRTAYAGVGPTFLFYLLPALLAIPLVPLLVYRLNNLRNSAYILERDSVHIQWGLRAEVIPTNAILWVRPASDLLETLHLPWFHWPGSVLGTRRLEGGIPVEFLASRRRDLILVATYERVFALSPSDPAAFLRTYQRLTELGSLIPPQPESVRPTFLLARVWQTPSARYLLALSILLSLGVVVWVSLAVPVHSQISLGFTPNGNPRATIPGVRLMLLPVLNTIFWVMNFFLGLPLFRREEHKPLVFLLWGNSALVAALFLAAVYFILKSG